MRGNDGQVKRVSDIRYIQVETVLDLKGPGEILRMTLWQTFRLFVLAIAVLALVLTLADDPFASVAQANERAQEETQNSGSSSELEALSQLADMTTVTDLAAVGSGPDDPYYIEPMVRARIAEYVEAQVQTAKTGIPATVSDSVPVGISSKPLDGDWSTGREALHQFLLDNGATYFDEGRNSADIYVPFTLLPRLVELPQFSRAQLAVAEDEDYPHPKLDRTLNNFVAGSLQYLAYRE